MTAGPVSPASRRELGRIHRALDRGAAAGAQLGCAYVDIEQVRNVDVAHPDLNAQHDGRPSAVIDRSRRTRALRLRRARPATAIDFSRLGDSAGRLTFEQLRRVDPALRLLLDL